MAGKRTSEGQSSQQPSTGKKAKPRMLWNSDGVDGGLSSLSILLDWLTTATNYTKFRGGDATCNKKKTAHAKDMLMSMKAAGIHHRTVKTILEKINDLEGKYRKASDWLANTGAGVEAAMTHGVM